MYGSKRLPLPERRRKLYQTDRKPSYYSTKRRNELKDLDIRINQAIQQALNGNLGSHTALDDLFDAQTLEKTFRLLKVTRPSEAPQSRRVDVVTADMICETFYNMIPSAVSDAIQEQLISDKAEYFDDLDGGLYLSIAALTLHTSSSNPKMSINRKVVNQQNCPFDEENEKNKASTKSLLKYCYIIRNRFQNYQAIH